MNEKMIPVLCKNCPFSLLCCLKSTPFFRKVHGTFLCPNCEKLIYTRWHKNTCYVYAFRCNKRIITPQIKEQWKRKNSAFTTLDAVTNESLIIMECVECQYKRTGLDSRPYRYHRVDFDNG